VDKLISKMTEVNANKQKNERKNVLLILERGNNIKELFVRGRHINIVLTISIRL
jgi:hypothetical protein